MELLSIVRSPRAALAVVGLGAGLVAASAATPDPASQEGNRPVPVSIDDSCREADLVFEGTVKSLAYRNSVALEEGDIVTPHTFVTFRLHEVLHGEVIGGPDFLTLRVMGGYGDDGTLTFTSHTPDFRVGSREIVFVKNHESWGTPFVHGTRRILLDGSVARTERGRPVADPATLRRTVYEQHADGAEAPAWTGDAFTADRARAWVARSLRAARRGQGSAPVRSADPNAPFSIGGLGHGLLQDEAATSIPSRALDDEERALVENDFNPVLR